MPGSDAPSTVQSPRWSGRRFDGLLTLAFVVVAITESLIKSDVPSDNPTVAAIAGVAVVVPILLRRVRPFLGLLLSEAAFVLPHIVFTYQVLFLAGFLVLVLQVAACAEHARPPWHWLALATVPLLDPLVYAFVPLASMVELGLDSVVFVTGWVVGYLLRTMRIRNAALRTALEQTDEMSELRTSAAVAAERVEIARELHDVVAHCVNVMVLQAASARVQLDRSPAASREAMQAVEQTGRDALIELRRVLSLLRAEDGGIDDPRGLADVSQFAQDLCRSGLLVEVTVEGEPARLPPAVDRSAFRVVQEGLTNALRHGSDTSATVTVRHRPDELELVIQNRAASSPAGSGGFGLIGMRERVAAFGGRLEAGADGGVYRLEAMFPLIEAPQ